MKVIISDATMSLSVALFQTFSVFRFSFFNFHMNDTKKTTKTKNNFNKWGKPIKARTHHKHTQIFFCVSAFIMQHKTNVHQSPLFICRCCCYCSAPKPTFLLLLYVYFYFSKSSNSIYSILLVHGYINISKLKPFGYLKFKLFGELQIFDKIMSNNNRA